MRRAGASTEIIEAYLAVMPWSPSPQLAEGSPAGPPVITVRVPEACRITGIGRSKLYELIRDGKVRTVKVGSITLIPLKNLAEFLGVDLPQ